MAVLLLLIIFYFVWFGWIKKISEILNCETLFKLVRVSMYMPEKNLLGDMEKNK